MKFLLLKYSIYFICSEVDYLTAIRQAFYVKGPLSWLSLFLGCDIYVELVIQLPVDIVLTASRFRACFSCTLCRYSCVFDFSASQPVSVVSVLTELLQQLRMNLATLINTRRSSSTFYFDNSSKSV